MGGTIRTCMSWLILPIEVIRVSGVRWASVHVMGSLKFGLVLGKVDLICLLNLTVDLI